MDFNQLMARMQELDSPALEGTTEGCGMMPPAPVSPKPDTPPPSMSVNVNAQGMDNIESMLALIAKLNGAGKADMPSMTPMPTVMPMIPDMDGDNDNKVGGEMDLPKDHNKDHMIVKTLDKDDDGDHDMDDHEKEAAPAVAGAVAGGLGKAAGALGQGMKTNPNKVKPANTGVGAEDDEDELGQGMKTDPNKVKPANTGVGAVADDFDIADLLKLSGQESEGAEDLLKGFSDMEALRAGQKEKDMAAIRDAIKGLFSKGSEDDNTDPNEKGGFTGTGEFPEKEAYSNEPDEMRKGADYMNNKLAGGMNRPKDTHPKVSDGDNPMKRVKEGNELRAQIRAELAAKLEQFKGAK